MGTKKIYILQAEDKWVVVSQLAALADPEKITFTLTNFTSEGEQLEMLKVER